MAIADLIVPFKIDDKSGPVIRRALNNMQRLERTGTRAAKALAAGAGIAAGTIAAAGAAAFVATKAWADNAKQMNSLAKTAGVTTKEFTSLNYAFERTGSDANDTASVLREVEIKLYDAALGTQSAVEAFDLLGVSIDELRDSDTSTAFRIIVDELHAIEDATLRIGIADTILGGSEAANFLAISSKLAEL